MVSPGVLPLEAGIVEDGSRVRKVRFFADGQPLGMVEKRPWKFECPLFCIQLGHCFWRLMEACVSKQISRHR